MENTHITHIMIAEDIERVLEEAMASFRAEGFALDEGATCERLAAYDNALKKATNPALVAVSNFLPANFPNHREVADFLGKLKKLNSKLALAAENPDAQFRIAAEILTE